MTPEERIIRFWERVDKTGNGYLRTWDGTPCWLWTGCTNRDGYGKAASGKRSRFVLAHREAWLLDRGAIPDGKFVLHRCDNPPCVNLGHLYLGTLKDNSRDMVVRRRGGLQKLSLEDRDEIRCLLSSGVTKQTVMDRFGVKIGILWVVMNRAHRVQE